MVNREGVLLVVLVDHDTKGVSVSMVGQGVSNSRSRSRRVRGDQKSGR